MPKILLKLILILISGCCPEIQKCSGKIQNDVRKGLFMYQYTDTNSHPYISLSDCRIEKIRLENRDIIFEFDDMGFWFTDSHPQNPYKTLLRTDKSEVRFVNVDPRFTFINYHAEVYLAEKKLLTKRIEVSMGEFISKINNRRWTLYVTDEYYGVRRVIICGSLFRDAPPYAADVQIEVYYQESRYYWNKICEDRTW